MGLDGAIEKERRDREAKKRVKRFERFEREKKKRMEKIEKAEKQAKVVARQAENRKRSQFAQGYQSPNTQSPNIIYICKDCGYEGKPGNISRGNSWIEIILWGVFILIVLSSLLTALLLLAVPIIYSIWRHAGKKGCPECHGHMINKDSPMGKKLIKELEL